MKARYLKSASLEELRDEVPKNLTVYRSGSFGYLGSDPSRFFEGPFEIEEVALRAIEVDDNGDFKEEENCAGCYRALSRLTPYEARDERFWVYLTHTLLLDYSRKRWPIPSDNELAVKHIQTHFFAKDKRQIERDNAASRLWWMAHLCQRVEGLPLEEALKVLLFRADVRASIIERPTASQSVEVFTAIMKRLHESYKGQKTLFDRAKFRPFMIRINSIGGIKLLDCMPERQITAVVSRVIESDLKLQTL